MTNQVIKDIVEIDKEFYLDFDYNDISWYFTRYSENNEITVLKVNNKIVGYYLFLTISENLFKDICNLKYSGDYDFPEEQVNVNSYIYYLPSVLVKAKFRNFTYLLLKELIKDFLKKEKVVAIAVSDEGKRMCGKYMKCIGCPRQNIWVYKRCVGIVE